MPFIAFDENGVCNYCLHYKSRNHPRPKEELFALVEPFRRKHGDEVLVPFSGGRDSSYGLHLIINELGLRPVTYTYDWGMVTDLGRRNVSRMSSKLGVENIIVAADITKKRDYIRRNLNAWIKSPHLGMLSVLTAGDKHFFRHIETLKRQTGVSLNLWGINPLEVTHFKSGFLGVPPDFAEERVYSHGAMKQLRYQSLRFRAMLQSPGYFNRSIPDTLAGEYYRSFTNEVGLLPHLRLLALGREAHRGDPRQRVRVGARARHPDHLADRRRDRGVLQLRVLHDRRVHRARHVPQQPGPRGRPHPRRGAAPRRGGEHPALPEPQVVPGRGRRRLRERDQRDQPGAAGSTRGASAPVAARRSPTSSRAAAVRSRRRSSGQSTTSRPANASAPMTQTAVGPTGKPVHHHSAPASRLNPCWSAPVT